MLPHCFIQFYNFANLVRVSNNLNILLLISERLILKLGEVILWLSHLLV